MTTHLYCIALLFALPQQCKQLKRGPTYYPMDDPKWYVTICRLLAVIYRTGSLVR